MDRSDLFHSPIPPSNVDGPNQVQTMTTGAAASQAVFTGLAAANRPIGHVYVVFEAITKDAYVRFGSTVTTDTTAANGLLIKAGEVGRVFLLHPTKHALMDVLGSGGAGVLNWQVCSPPCDRLAI